MTWPPWLCRLVPYLRRREAEADLEEELRIHLELERERQRDAGVPESEALRAARRKLGSAALIRERAGDVWAWRWLDDLRRDVRHALRGLRRTPGFTAAAVLVLALGIGAGTATFAIVHGVLLRPLPYRDAVAIVFVGEARGMPSRSPVFLSNATLPQIRREARSFEELATYREGLFDWASPDGPVTLHGARVSASLFPLLGATAHVGRLLTEEDARPDAEPVAVLSYRAWTGRFGADPGIVGSVLPFDEPRTVVGVLAAGLEFPGPDSELWVPDAIPPFTPLDPADRERRTERMVSVTGLGRLRPGVSPEEAAAEVRAILQRGDTASARGFARGMRLVLGGRASEPAEGIDARVIPLREGLVGRYRPALLALTAAALFVLLLAGANVAGLLLARGATRQRTLAVSAAIGAGRSRIARQLLTESMLLSLCGGALGLGAAAVVLRAVPALAPGDVPHLDEVGVDGVALAFALGLSVAAGLAFGAAPAFRWSRFQLVRALHEGSAPSTGGSRPLRAGRMGAGLAAAQVALALLLLVGAGLLLRSFVGLLLVDRGYDPAGVITARIRNPDTQVRIGAREGPVDLRAESRRFHEALLVSADRIAQLPGVTAVGLASDLPLAAGGAPFSAVHVEGRPLADDPGESSRARIRLASPGFFDALRLRLLSGRFFNRLDGPGGPRVVVVNETFAREVFDGEPAVGREVWVGFEVAGGPGRTPPARLPPSLHARGPWRVVGVAADVRYEGLVVAESPAEAFFSTHQSEAVPRFGGPLFVAVRTTGDPRAVVASLREAAAEAHPRATVADVMTMDERLSVAVARPRFHAGFAGFFALVALLLAACGIHGRLSYAVARRRREIGVRLALGAQRSDIARLFVRRGAALVAVGAVAGLLAAAASSRVLEGFLYGVSSGDGLAFAGAACALAGALLPACWLPARRAARIDPIEVLRLE